MRKLLLVLVLVAAVALGWLLREHWLGDGGPKATRRTTAIDWQTLSEARAATARAELAKLARPRGPGLVTLEPGDLGSLVLVQIAKELPPSADSIQAAVIEDMYHVRASVDPRELGGEDVLGSLAGFLSDRETMQIGGTFDLLRPGLAQYHVKQIRLREFLVPERLVPRLMARIRRGAPVEGLASDALPIVVPESIGDVRIADGRVTLYKATQ